ncbi:MAG TPA: YMGG-like glycine zipper-containing protein [Desulfuromonadales bacterium]|nr:YMGG-like glycine zipper-containing protein [Desulfuromonadales bacterium]
MKSIRILMVMILLAFISGCATVPLGPDVTVLPAPGKSFDKFRTEDSTCREWAAQQLGMSPGQTYQNNVATGAATGTAVGAGLGAALGSLSGQAGGGALVGAASGLLFGSAIGSDAGQVNGSVAQRRYDTAYMQCMYTYGNQVPGFGRVAQAPQPAAVVPPQVSLESAPLFLYSPPIGMYVAVDVPYDLLYTRSHFLFFYSGNWYRGPFYDGPWTYLPRQAYPPALHRFGIGHIRHLRAHEYGRYENDRAHFVGRIYRPQIHGRWH